MRNYQTLDAWRTAMQLVKEVYMLTKIFPKEELYTLTSQVKRAAVLIPFNIAEGMGRQYKKDTLQFLYISRGSIYELETHLNIALTVEIIKEKDFYTLTPLIDKAIQLLSDLIKYTEKAVLE